MTRNQTILIVDDESHIVHVVSLKLRNAGYNILTAADGEEGLAMALEHQPDLLITDYQMPYMTGLELCLELKKRQGQNPIPALMLTARGFRLASEYTEQANIVGLLSKPFSPREVLTRADDVLAGTSELREAS
jgi:two-component system alkaline phosphatase synthesis response regulator PhoP